MNIDVPVINNRFVCVVDHANRDLAAVISSYLSKPNNYLPLFAFPSVGSKNDTTGDPFEEDFGFAKNQAQIYATYLNNVLARIGGCEYLILAGLSEDQKSYLDFTMHFNVIDIDDIYKVDFLLSGFHEPRNIVECKTSDLLLGLLTALRRDSILKINELADPIISSLDEIDEYEGIVIIEETEYVETIISINYAYSVNAAVQIVAYVDNFNNSSVLSYIQDWKLKDDVMAFSSIQEIVDSRIGSIQFSNYKWATFFTYGIPYSLIIKNLIPCSYVRLKSLVDLFIINNLIFEGNQRLLGEMKYGGAVVFSPQFFPDEEIEVVCSIFSLNNFFTKELFGTQASVINLDMHFKEFPFDIFHICSHGGEMDGWTVEQEYKDRFGKKHTVIYDEVVSVSKSQKSDKVRMQHKLFPRKLNGFEWNSEELRRQKYPTNVIQDMFKATHQALAKDKKILARKRIPNSCFIECADGFYQGMFRFVASHSSPVIFNNSCWSWFEMSEAFLISGIRGYIGTLWNVSNASAIKFADKFYKNAFGQPIISVVHQSLKELQGSKFADIYVFWGLHFATISSQKDKNKSRVKICKQLLLSYYMWDDKLRQEIRKNISNNILELRNWAKHELTHTFNANDHKLLLSDLANIDVAKNRRISK